MSSNFYNRKNIRLKNYDYVTNGYYFVTICSYKNNPYIGVYKELVRRILLSLPDRFTGLKIDYYILMNNHLHLILVFNDVKSKLGEVIRSFKSLVTKECGVKNFWQRNYYEHVIRNEEALLKIREYIINNPMRERIEFEQFYM